MLKRFASLLGSALLVLSVFAQPFTARAVQASDGAFVVQADGNLRLNGQIFRFAGTNNYYLMYASQFMVDDVLNSAAQAGQFRVLRTWGWLDIGNQDGSNSVAGGKANGVYFQYWNGSAPAYNDGPDGLQRLDYVIAKAGALGLKLVIPFTNNWSDFGGMDQYVRWAGGQYHDDFYTSPVIRQWYKNWISHVLNHTNSVNGIAYKDDPTIMTWELGNEPRCGGSGVYPTSKTCTVQTLTSWANDLSHFIKGIDENHLVSVGDEGFYCTDPKSDDWTLNCSQGVDTVAFAALPNIDVMSFHLYPDYWGKTPDWGTQWITSHFAAAKAIHRPAMLGEFGLLNKAIRNPVYQQWTGAVFNSGGAGGLYWILSGQADGGGYYPDYDGFTVYAFNPVFITLTNFSKMMTANRALVFPPVADNDAAVTEYNTPITLTPLANDITYGGATLVPSTLDLDPAASGVQSTVSVYGGTFSAQPDGSVIFTPTAGFNGKSAVSYTVQDSAARLSNVAAITVTVKPNPSGALMLFSFETGTEGWASASWQANAGVVSQSTDFATDGTHSLKIDTTGADGGWFGVTFATPIDLSAKSQLVYDLKTTNAGTSTSLAMQVGSSWMWCQVPFGWVNGSTTTQKVAPFSSLGCANPDLTQVHSIYLWISGGGVYYIDAVQAQ